MRALLPLPWRPPHPRPPGRVASGPAPASAAGERDVILSPPEGLPAAMAAGVTGQRAGVLDALRARVGWGPPARGGPDVDPELLAPGSGPSPKPRRGCCATILHTGP